MRETSFDPARLPGFAIIAIAVFVLLYLPIVTLVAYSFNGGESVAVWGGFSLDWYGRAWANDTVKAAALRSLVIAASASAIATVLATLAAIGIVRNRRMRGRSLAYMAINQPLMVPEIVTAVALLLFFATLRQVTGYQGLGYLIAAHAAFCIPFAYLPISARLEGMDATLEAAAADLYASPFQAFRHVTLPLLMPGIAAGAMLAFVISLDDVVITEFVKSAGQDTLPTYMLGQMRRGVSPEVNAISTMLLLVTVILLTAFFVINRQTNRGRT
jgi:spermidine/putrescine transport system permease protein